MYETSKSARISKSWKSRPGQFLSAVPGHTLPCSCPCSHSTARTHRPVESWRLWLEFGSWSTPHNPGTVDRLHWHKKWVLSLCRRTGLWCHRTSENMGQKKPSEESHHTSHPLPPRPCNWRICDSTHQLIDWLINWFLQVQQTITIISGLTAKQDKIYIHYTQYTPGSCINNLAPPPVQIYYFQSGLNYQCSWVHFQ